MEARSRRMSRKVLVAVLSVAIVAAAGTAAWRLGRRPALEGRREKLSYAMGMDLGAGARKQGVELDGALVARGLRDALSGSPALLTDEEARTTLLELQGEMRAKRAAAERALAEKNGKEGEAFLAGNGTKEGVVTLPSGLQYRVVVAGEGRRPMEDDVVQCSYRGTRVDGSEFDSSERRGQPASFRVSALIPGWREALKLMPVGSRWQLFVPPSLAYGTHPPRNMPQIGPNATLVYDVQLLAIQPAGGAEGTRRRAVEGRSPTRFQAR